MSKKYRVGIIGVCHVHVHNVAAIFQNHPKVELIAVADTTPDTPEISESAYTRKWNLNYLVNDMGIPNVYDEYQEMLRKENLDIVICNSENAKHPEVVQACAETKTHVCVEKPMASSLADALEMDRFRRDAGIETAIHWYMPFSPQMMKMKALIEEGAIGNILEVRTRIAHAGPLAVGARHPGPNIETESMTEAEKASTWWYQQTAGGGATIDFCSYGAVIARWLIGETATDVMGMRMNLNSPWAEADDNGVITARFPKAVGVFQGSWTTLYPGEWGNPVVYGTEGTIVVDEWGSAPGVYVWRGQEKHEEFYKPDSSSLEYPDIAHAFIHSLDTGAPLHETLDPVFNLDAMAIVDAGIRSAESGKLEEIQRVGEE